MASSGSVESMAPFTPGGEERIFSIMVSTSELAKLDLSNILLFPANVDCTQNSLKDREKEFDSTSVEPQESFPLPLEAGEGASMAPVQVFKSVGVIEAEKTLMEHNRGSNSRHMKSVSMDETRSYRFRSRGEAPEAPAEHDKPRPQRLDRLESRGKENQERQHVAVENQESRDVAEERKIKKDHDDPTVQDKPRPQPLPVKSTRAEEERAEAKEIMRIKAGIDLKASHASKFLMQVTPLELQPSPLTPFTPAAVPFKWEEVPGKPKNLHEPCNQLLPQNNSLPALHPPPRLLMSPSAAKKLTALQSQSVAQHSSSSLGSWADEENRVISIDMKRLEKNTGSVISSLDNKLPPLWNGHVKAAYSPFRGLGPPDDAVQRLRKKAASALISVWRKAVWREVLVIKWRRRKRGNITLSYESLDR